MRSRNLGSETGAWEAEPGDAYLRGGRRLQGHVFGCFFEKQRKDVKLDQGVGFQVIEVLEMEVHKHDKMQKEFHYHY